MSRLLLLLGAIFFTSSGSGIAGIVSVELPQTLQEGRSREVLVARWPAGDTALTVNLTSSDAAALDVPATVTIPEGMYGAVITVTVADNEIRDGSRIVTVTAAAEGHDSGVKAVTIRDDEVASYALNPFTDIMPAPVGLRVTARDIEGNTIDFAGEVHATVLKADGTALPNKPKPVKLEGPFGGFAYVKVPALADGLRLHVEDAQGLSVQSPVFYAMRGLGLPNAGLVYDSRRKCFYASVPTRAASVHAGRVVKIDPNTLQIASGPVMQDPGPLALSSDGTALYVGLNGNATVAKLNPVTLVVDSAFAVGVDPDYGTLIADEFTTVAGHPNQLIVSTRQAAQPYQTGGVVLFLNGQALPAKLLIPNSGLLRVERSADPSIFFVYGSTGFRRVRRDANGLTQLAVSTHLFPSEPSSDIVSTGNTVVSTTGVAVDGATMRLLGRVATQRYEYLGPVRPDPARNRLYFLNSSYPPPSSSMQSISVYDPQSYQLIRRFTAPTMTASGGLIRWGQHGLAFRSPGSIALINSSQIVPHRQPANVRVSVQSNSGSPAIGAPLVYSVTVANHGPETARDVFVRATISAGQQVPLIAPSTPDIAVTPSGVSLPIGDLPAGTQVEFSITTAAQAAGLVSCTVAAQSASLDPDLTDNVVTKFMNVGYALNPNSVQALRFGVDNLIYDPTRHLLWLAISDPNMAGFIPLPVGPTVLGMDPSTGEIRDSIPLSRHASLSAMAMSANGRYLYVGLYQASAVQRINLSTTPARSVLIPLAANRMNDETVTDMEVLDGAGTSFVATSANTSYPTVYDGRVPRSGAHLNWGGFNQIEKTGTPGVFVTYNGGSTLTSVKFDTSGTTILKTIPGGISGFGGQMRASGDLLLSETGVVVNTGDLTFKLNLNAEGRPILDAPNQHAYLVNGTHITRFSTSSGLSLGKLALTDTLFDIGWPKAAVRWGTDGLAVAGSDAKLYIARWSSVFGP